MDPWIPRNTSKVIKRLQIWTAFKICALIHMEKCGKHLTGQASWQGPPSTTCRPQKKSCFEAFDTDWTAFLFQVVDAERLVWRNKAHPGDCHVKHLAWWCCYLGFGSLIDSWSFRCRVTLRQHDVADTKNVVNAVVQLPDSASISRSCRPDTTSIVYGMQNRAVQGDPTVEILALSCMYDLLSVVYYSCILSFIGQILALSILPKL